MHVDEETLAFLLMFIMLFGTVFISCCLLDKICTELAQHEVQMDFADGEIGERNSRNQSGWQAVRTA